MRLRFLRSRAFKLILLFGLLVPILSLGGLYKVSSSPRLCYQCHIMRPYYAAWANSKHHFVACVDCHYPPGFRDTLWVKYQALSQVAKWATKTYSSKPFAEIEDGSCLRSGCHSLSELKGQRAFGRGVIFDHAPHREKVPRVGQLRCTSCHSQIVVGTHIEVTTTTCYLCHFKGMKTPREFHPLGGCPLCHTPPKGDIQVGRFTFNHEALIKRDVACEKCHLNVVEGGGEAPRERCVACHNQPEKLRKYADIPFIHDFHVAGRNIECTRCHSEIRHQLPPPIGLTVSGLLRRLFAAADAEASEQPVGAQPGRLGPPRPEKAPEDHPPPRSRPLECKACHQATHQGVLDMYVGMGGKGTPIIPSHMFQVRVECVACHIEPERQAAEARLRGQTFRPSEKACLGCHGTRFQGMLNTWKTATDSMLAVVIEKFGVVEESLATLPPSHPQHARATQRLADARHNVGFVTHGKGVHNVFFAADLLKVANDYLDQAMRTVGKPPVKVRDEVLVRGGYCAILCHNQAGVKAPEQVKFGRETVPHVRHVTEFGVTCTACHSAERHKAVTATKASCLACHHQAGNDNKHCLACHKLQVAFFEGTLDGPGSAKTPALGPHVGLADCVACHDVTAKHSRRTVAKQCLGCHDETYVRSLEEWTKSLDRGLKEVKALLRKGGAGLRRSRAEKEGSEARRLLEMAKGDAELVERAGGAHNPELARAILAKAKKAAEEAIGLVTR